MKSQTKTCRYKFTVTHGKLLGLVHVPVDVVLDCSQLVACRRSSCRGLPARDGKNVMYVFNKRPDVSRLTIQKPNKHKQMKTCCRKHNKRVANKQQHEKEKIILPLFCRPIHRSPPSSLSLSQKSLPPPPPLSQVLRPAPRCSHRDVPAAVGSAGGSGQRRRQGQQRLDPLYTMEQMKPVRRRMIVVRIQIINKCLNV